MRFGTHRIALAAVSAVTGWTRDRTDLARLWLEINPANLASQRLAGKAGFVLNKRLPGHCRRWLAKTPGRTDGTTA